MVQTSTELLRTSDICLRHEQRNILDQVTLEIRAGEIVTVIGPNGAGKTTLLRIALGLLKPSAGTVWRRPGLKIGYMPQRLQIDWTFPLQVRRFVSMANPQLPADALQQIIGEVGIEPLLERPLAGLSGGELQRVLLGRALLRRPELLVLDEPAQGLDVHGQVEFFRLMADIRQRHGCAILLVSHDLHLVMAATDRVVCLNRHICCSGSPGAVTRDPAFLQLFGPLAGDLAIYTHDKKHRHPL
jgi:zinc transport system ATP-binding protein